MAILRQTIQCPECLTIQQATVIESVPFNTYIHYCENCKYVITESDWNEIIES